MDYVLNRFLRCILAADVLEASGSNSHARQALGGPPTL